ncbi:antigen 5 like allergen Cul n 1-like isoform X2 [Drosophila rhopaloa]|uniref:Uncharacterized protein LOC108046709 isoform X2 n=1 Tax=Drosophila rhopaloa TaxID=1041015 RepID=A0A6P4F3Y1_DRORH|nr:antigen 5 like allergen Cul n 1-like isoform X2 [Drosophila rhopaloa]
MIYLLVTSHFHVLIGFLLFCILDVVNSMNGTDYCKLKNCPADKKLTHIACNNKGDWSPQCGKNPKIITMTRKVKMFIVRYHNTYRDIVAGTQFHRLPNAGRMLKMRWSQDLAYLAELMVKRCDLKPTEHCLSTEQFPAPSYHAVYNKFKKNENEFRVVRSQLNSWYDQYKHVSALSLLDGVSSSKKEIGHFLRMMVGPSNRLGCAMARIKKDGKTQQWLSCLYSCAPKKNQALYEYSTKPGAFCTTGVDRKYQHLCNRTEPVENCSHSELFKGAVTNDTASLIRGMMHKKVQSRTCWLCYSCCYWWNWAFGYYTYSYTTYSWTTTSTSTSTSNNKKKEKETECCECECECECEDD